ALDVGDSQLDESLKNNSRVEAMENTDIRDFAREAKFEDEGMKFDVVTCDVSFISVTQILADIIRVANKDIIILFKPQFEVGREAKRNKKGVVTDAKAVSQARAKFELAAANLSLALKACQQCEIKGKEGNAEFFYAFNKG
ncbi:SAM-dependent methyltransferase, partial [Campylobacter sp.]|uniref:SAM-dependent methyltransferase n=1 Tax=Campylobacter sp. TaxID=205 RepID=UPI0026FF38FB|nr:SAM-dependent methyltransferase [Campylobacter sp.]